MGTINFTGTGGVWEGSAGAAGVVINQDYAMDFDGVDDKITVGNHPSYANGTIAFWAKCKVHDSNHRRAIEDRNGGSEDYFQLFSNSSSDKMSWTLNNEQSGGGSHTTLSMSSDDVIPLNVWQHYAVVWGTGGRKMYVNGVIQNESSGESGAVTNAT